MRVFHPLSCLLSLALAGLSATGLRATAPPSSTLGNNVDLYSVQPTLGVATTVQNWELPVGRMTFRMVSGTAAPLISKSGMTLGFHFTGKASFRFQSDSPLERASLVSNFKKNLEVTNSKATLSEASGHQILTEEVKSFTLWCSGAPILLPSGALTEAPSASFARDFTFFEKDGLGDRGHDFAVNLTNTRGRGLRRAEISGVDSPFLYILDEGCSQLESLWAVAEPNRASSYDGLRRILLSQQPLGWTWKQPLSPVLSLTSVDIDLKADQGSADLKVTETLVAGDESLAVVSLDLYTESDPAYKLRKYHVSRVLDDQGKPLSFHHRRNEILVQLNQSHPMGQPFTLTFEYGGPILLRPGGDNYWELGVEPWFPQPGMDGQAYTVHALIRTHKDDVPIACGKTIRRESTEQGNLLEVRIDKPVQFFSVFAGAYSFTEETKDGLTIRVAAYATHGGNMQKRLLGIARQTIGFYEQVFEKFPFEEYNIVQVNSYGYGQAPPGMMIITNEAFTGKIDIISSIFTRGINERFAHEIAHQYWGHLVKMPSHEEQWITESFANYSAALAMRAMKNKGDSTYEGMLSGWRNQASAYTELGTIPFANRLQWINDPRATFMARTSLLYDKGALILAVLHKEMGDRQFALFMKSIIANFRWKAANTPAIEQIATMAGHKDYGPLFRDCYWGTQMPK
jgi:hypothetical protein